MLDLRHRIARRVSGVFNDATRGESPVVRRPDGMFGPEAVAWQVHGDVTTMMIGGVSSLLLQMLHPAVLAGVWDHSNFRADMHGRLRRTARFIALTTYGSREEASAAIERVKDVHSHIAGILPDGMPYRADEPELLAWVHVTEAISFLDAWRRYAEPAMSRTRQDRYLAEVAQIGIALGADPIPVTRKQAEQLILGMRSSLRVDDRTRSVANLIFAQKAEGVLLQPGLALTLRAGVDLLPPWARTMHGFRQGVLQRQATRIGAAGLASTLRWAFTRRVPPAD